MGDWDAFPTVDSPTKLTVHPSSAWDSFPQVNAGEVQTRAPEQARTTAAGLAKSMGAGLVSGAAGIVGLPGTMQDLVHSGVDKAISGLKSATGVDLSGPEQPPEQPPTLLPSGAGVTSAIEQNVTGPLYKPQTPAEGYAKTISEFLPAALAGPGGMVRNAVKFAAVPGAASEFAGQQTAGTAAEPYARAAAGLATGLAAGALSGPAAANGVVRSRMAEGVTPQVVQQARTLMLDAQQRGVRLTWPEAIEQVHPGSGLPSLQRVVEGAPQSRPAMQEFYADRPAQIEQAGRGGVANIAPPNAAPSNIGPEIGRAAEGTVNDTRDAINQTARPFYDAASTVRLTPQEMARVRALPGYTEARDAVRNDPQLNRYVNNLPEDSYGFLNEVKKYFNAASENASAPVNAQRNMQRSAGYGRDASAVRNELVSGYFGNPARNYETALNIESHGRQQFLQPLLDGPIGRLAKSDITTKNAIEALFPSNPLPNSQQEISRAVAALVQRNPGAAEQLVRAHIESTFNEATQAIQSGANQGGGSKFWARLAGNSQQRQNLQAGIEALPNGAARWQGFERLLDIMEATGKRMAIGSNTSFNDLELAMTRGGTTVEGAAKLGLSPGKWLSTVNDKVSQWRQGRNLTQLAGMMTDPAAGRAFERIAAAPRDVEARLMLGRLILSTGAAVQSAIGSKKPFDKTGR